MLAQLRAKAHTQGGNAIIYVSSAVTDRGEADVTCAAVRRGESLGSGWVVVLGDEPAPAP